MAKLDQIIQEFRSELGSDFISTDVVGMDGMSIAGGSVDPNFDASDASARFTMVMKLASKVSSKIGMGKVEDNLVTTNKTYIVSRFLGDCSYYWVVVVSRNATLGTVRMLMNEYMGQLWDAIPTEAKRLAAMPLEEKLADTTPLSVQSRPTVPVAQPRPPAPVEQKVSAPAPIVETLVEEKKPEEVIIPEEKPAKEKSKFPVFRSPYNFP
jgi:predicted regulator of Ras-like GTPase activity (Roadblock/LC7/MglB family)